MCAIIGIIGQANHKMLKKMSDCQIYRGPDSQNFLSTQNKNIGMNRLAVIDKKILHNRCFQIQKVFDCF